MTVSNEQSAESVATKPELTEDGVGHVLFTAQDVRTMCDILADPWMATEEKLWAVHTLLSVTARHYGMAIMPIRRPDSLVTARIDGSIATNEGGSASE